jgi:hypothetical protein
MTGATFWRLVKVSCANVRKWISWGSPRNQILGRMREPQEEDLKVLLFKISDSQKEASMPAALGQPQLGPGWDVNS